MVFLKIILKVILNLEKSIKLSLIYYQMKNLKNFKDIKFGVKKIHGKEFMGNSKNLFNW